MHVELKEERCVLLSETMGHVRCARVADYAAALCRGNTYEVLDGNERNVKIRTEEGRVRWFPRTCFVPAGTPLWYLVDFRIGADVEAEPCVQTEVTMVLQQDESEPVHSETRWCYFVTPQYLRQRFEEQAASNEAILPVQLGLNGMVLPVLSHSSIAQALRYLEMQDQLSVCTEPL